MERSKEVNKHREVHRVKTEHLVRISSDHRSVVGSMNLTFYPIRKSLSLERSHLYLLVLSLSVPSFLSRMARMVRGSDDE